jgi:hypothetical protein
MTLHPVVAAGPAVVVRPQSARLELDVQDCVDQVCVQPLRSLVCSDDEDRRIIQLAKDIRNLLVLSIIPPYYPAPPTALMSIEPTVFGGSVAPSATAIPVARRSRAGDCSPDPGCHIQYHDRTHHGNQHEKTEQQQTNHASKHSLCISIHVVLENFPPSNDIRLDSSPQSMRAASAAAMDRGAMSRQGSRRRKNSFRRRIGQDADNRETSSRLARPPCSVQTNGAGKS